MPEPSAIASSYRAAHAQQGRVGRSDVPAQQRHRGWNRRPACAFAVGLACFGCVQYTPVELGAVPPHEEVRVHVTTGGAVRLARSIGRLTEDVTATVRPEGDSVAVTIWLGKNYPGTEFENVRETVVLPRGEVTALQRRELSVWRTAAVSAGALAIVAVLANRIFQIGDPNRPPDDELPPPPSLLRLRFGGIP